MAARRRPDFLLRLALQALPPTVREDVHADLQEERADAAHAGRPWHPLRAAGEALAIATHYQREALADTATAWRSAQLLAAGALLMFAVPPALQTAIDGWQAVRNIGGPLLAVGHHGVALASSLGAGLLLGRVPPVMPRLPACRWPLAAVMAVIALGTHGPGPAALALAALVTGLCLGRIRARSAALG